MSKQHDISITIDIKNYLDNLDENFRKKFLYTKNLKVYPQHELPLSSHTSYFKQSIGYVTDLYKGIHGYPKAEIKFTIDDEKRDDMLSNMRNPMLHPMIWLNDSETDTEPVLLLLDELIG